MDPLWNILSPYKIIFKHTFIGSPDISAEIIDPFPFLFMFISLIPIMFWVRLCFLHSANHLHHGQSLYNLYGKMTTDKFTET